MEQTFTTLVAETGDSVRELTAKALQSQAGLAHGWVDDGTESGALRIVPPRNLVARAVRVGSSGDAFFRVQNNGCTISNVLSALRGLDYSSHYCSIQCPSGTYVYTKIRLSIYGRHFGVRWYWVTGYTTAPFEVIIDGRPYSVPVANIDADTQGEASAADPLHQWICPDLLDEGRHEVTLVFRGPVTGSTRNYVVRDILLDASAGYERQLPALALHGTQTLTTSYALVAPGSVWQSSNIRLGKLFFMNYSAGAITVTVASANSDTARFAAKSVAAGESWEVQIDALATPWVKASANSSVYCHATAGQL